MKRMHWSELGEGCWRRRGGRKEEGCCSHCGAWEWSGMVEGEGTHRKHFFRGQSRFFLEADCLLCPEGRVRPLGFRSHLSSGSLSVFRKTTVTKAIRHRNAAMAMQHGNAAWLCSMPCRELIALTCLAALACASASCCFCLFTSKFSFKLCNLSSCRLGLGLWRCGLTLTSIGPDRWV